MPLRNLYFLTAIALKGRVVSTPMGRGTTELAVKTPGRLLVMRYDEQYSQWYWHNRIDCEDGPIFLDENGIVAGAISSAYETFAF